MIWVWYPSFRDDLSPLLFIVMHIHVQNNMRNYLNLFWMFMSRSTKEKDVVMSIIYAIFALFMISKEPSIGCCLQFHETITLRNAFLLTVKIFGNYWSGQLSRVPSIFYGLRKIYLYTISDVPNIFEYISHKQIFIITKNLFKSYQLSKL